MIKSWVIYFTAHTLKCVCHSIRSMFGLLGLYNFGKRMKFLIIFVAFFGLAFGSDLFTGSWKEDQYKRENLGDYLYERGTFLLFFHYSYMFFGGSWPSNFLTFFMNENFEILQVRSRLWGARIWTCFFFTCDTLRIAKT